MTAVVGGVFPPGAAAGTRGKAEVPAGEEGTFGAAIDKLASGGQRQEKGREQRTAEDADVMGERQVQRERDAGGARQAGEVAASRSKVETGRGPAFEVDILAAGQREPGQIRPSDAAAPAADGEVRQPAGSGMDAEEKVVKDAKASDRMINQAILSALVAGDRPTAQPANADDAADAPEEAPETRVEDAAAARQTRPIEIVIANLMAGGTSLSALARTGEANLPGKQPTGTGMTLRADPRPAGDPTAGGVDAARTAQGADDLFRFARADGTMETVDLSAKRSAPDDGTAATAPEKPKASDFRATQPLDRPAVAVDGAAEREREGGGRILADVTVLETRKYLGVATNQTAVASVIGAVTENPEWNAMLRETAATSATILNAAKNASNSMKIQLSPVELGMVTATFRLSGGQLSIELQVETIEAYRQLSEDNGDIVRALKGHGYDVDHVTVHHVSNDRTHTALTQGESLHQNGQQSGQAMGEGRSAQSGRRDGERQPGGQQDGGDQQRGEGDRAPGAQPRSGGVYL